MSKRSASDLVLQRLSASDEAASLALVTKLCRQCQEFRLWLWNDFVRSPEVRKEFARVVDDAEAALPASFIELTGESRSWREERRRLRENISTHPFGGLSRSEVEILIRRYQAGNIDLGTFLLTHEWREEGKESPALAWAGLAFLDSLLPGRSWRAHSHLAKTFTLLRRFDQKAKRRALFSPSDWWKARLLFYLLRNPRGSYRTRELRAHLKGLGVEVSAKDIRRFCTRHGIRRDERAGRPRKSTKPGAGVGLDPR